MIYEQAENQWKKFFKLLILESILVIGGIFFGYTNAASCQKKIQNQFFNP